VKNKYCVDALGRRSSPFLPSDARPCQCVGRQKLSMKNGDPPARTPDPIPRPLSFGHDVLRDDHRLRSHPPPLPSSTFPLIPGWCGKGSWIDLLSAPLKLSGDGRAAAEHNGNVYCIYKLIDVMGRRRVGCIVLPIYPFLPTRPIRRRGEGEGPKFCAHGSQEREGDRWFPTLRIAH
jgi:hypothetical protein